MPTSYQGYSQADWARSMTTTLAEHIRDEENAMMRNFQLLALLENNGRTKFNCAGRGRDCRRHSWIYQFRSMALHNFADMYFVAQRHALKGIAK